MNISVIAQDVRFALRQVRRAPGFAISAILTLAIGVGANTGIFSLLNGYWRPLPVPDANRIVVIAADLAGDEGGLWYRFSFPELADYRAQTQEVFSDVFAFDTRIGGLTVGGRTTQFLFHTVSGNLFSGLQVAPFLGRLFAPGEGEHLGSEPLLVLGHACWQKRFGADPAVVGRVVRIDGHATRIIGVSQPGFHGLYQGPEIEGYVTLGSDRGRATATGKLFADRSVRYLTMMARLRPGVGLSTAQGAVDVVAARLQAAHPVVGKNLTARVIPEPSARPTPQRKLSGILPLIRSAGLGLATLVLLIACMNVANLLMVRATARQREMAVRAALGSGRSRLIRLLLVESLLLGSAGTAAGLVLARWSTDLFLASIDPAFHLPLNLDFDFDWRVFLYAAGIALLTGVLLGIVPAYRASRAQVTALLHDGGYGTSVGRRRLRVRNVLVVAQVAGSLVLLVVAGLFIRSLQRGHHVDVGFDPRHIVTVRLDPGHVGYTSARAAEFYDELERRLAALPGVQSVGMSLTIPMGYLFDGARVIPDGQTVDSNEPEKLVGRNIVTPQFFETLRLPIVAGRAFTKQDIRGSTPVIIVNETLARQFWPGQNAVGKRLTIPRLTDTVAWEVVGVARDSKYVAVFEGPTPHLYVPLAQHHTSMRVVYVKTAASAESFAPLLEREVQRLNPDIPLADLRTMEQALEGGVGLLFFKIGAVQATAMGLLGLLLAVVGVYSVVSYGASQRTREMGIRVALGAKPKDVGGLVLRQGAWLVSSGIVAGLLAAAGVTHLIGRFFVLVGSTDAVTFGGVTALLSAVALVACYLPARRAMRVDPMIALRHE